jgi:cytosine deaminase
MRTVIAGGHGKIALRLERRLTARGDSAVGLIRNPGHADDLRAVGAVPVVLDLESASVDEVAAVLDGADAAVFAAGAGPGSGAERKQTVDHAAAVLLADAAERAGVRRFLVVSSINADAQATGGGDPVFTAYLRAKGQADEAIRSRTALDWTILRPGALTDSAGTGRITLTTGRAGRGSVPREDVAATLVALLLSPETAGLTLELLSGDTPVEEAVRRAAGA